MQDVRPSTVALLLVVGLAVVSVPVLTHPLPPLSDYINNLARAYVISTIGTDADFQRFYTIEWRIIPNLMMDLVVPVLHRFMGLYAAGQVFTLAAFGLILSGAFALHRALFGRWSVVPIAAAIILYNEVLLVGVMNYIFGMGLALWALASWIWLRESRWRFAASTLFVIALFFCHLFALGVYGVGVLAFEGHRLWAKRQEPLAPHLFDFAAGGAPFLVAAVLLFASPTRGLAGEFYWEFWGKFQGLLLVFTVYYYSIAALLIAALAFMVAWASRRGILRLHPLGWALVLIGGVVYLAMPRAIFAAHLADQRLPIALAFMLIACMDIDLREQRVRRMLAALFVALLAIRLTEVQFVWNRLAPQIADFRNSVMKIERGSQILVTHADRDAYARDTVSDFGLLHAASLATIERSALVSTAFAVSGKHVLQVRPPYRRHVSLDDRVPPSADWLTLAAGPNDETDRFYWSQWHLHFDYVYVLFTKPGRPNPDSEHLALAAEGPGFQLYRVIRAV